MCGRFTLTADQDSFEDRFSLTRFDLGWVPSFNIAPTQEVLTVTNDGSENRPELMRWGLVPSWAKDPKIGNRMINARSETLAEKPSFRTAFKRRRCLIPADGFYEWKREGKAKKPMLITANPGGLFAFAGLWETWKQPDDSWLLTCAIITTSANEFMKSIHDRMPVILPRESEASWLDPEEQDTAMLSELLLPYDSDRMEAYEVSTLVNSPRNNFPEVIEPVATLF
ncbi:MAG: SOS response-associated peptidase [Dehalococcoidia bacterium]|nr:SOS response-associated peptidase [Dehalococcoidia bacterium]